MTQPVVSAVVVDCHDPAMLAAFWYELLGGEMVLYPQQGVVALRAPGITFDFTLVTDDKVTKNRLHLDLATADPVTSIVNAIEYGADLVAKHDDHTVLRDPEGNEFCILHGAPADRPFQPPN